MSNLSKEKRDNLLKQLQVLRENADEELQKTINELETTLVAKRYGLVWEQHEERADQEVLTKVPYFVLDERSHIKDASYPCNYLLQGDNLHALHLLNKTHHGKIDIIYIDPPYNTGENDFVYNDSRVDKDDSFRHSKWLSFMETRLRLAYDLLSDRGVIFVSIDDHEQAVLKVLLDEIFSQDNFVITIPRITKNGGKTTDSFAKNHDYIHVYVKKNKDIFAPEYHYDSGFCNADQWVEERGKYKRNQTLDYDSLSYGESMDYALEIEGEVFYPGGSKENWLKRQQGEHRTKDWIWRWSKAKFDFGYANGFVEIVSTKEGKRIYTKTYENATIVDAEDGFEIDYIERSRFPRSIDFIHKKYSNDNAKKDLKTFALEKEFQYAKPVSLVKKLIQCHKEKDITVLDFFAGSGTTAQAVLEANAEDGGNRRYILCTNNENEICENVTFVRCNELSHRDLIEVKARKKVWERTVSGTSFNQGNAEEILKDIEFAKASAKEKYRNQSTAVYVEDDKVCMDVVSKHRYDNHVNLVYYRVENEALDSENLENVLTEHVKLLIQLQYGCVLTEKVQEAAGFAILLHDEDADALEERWSSRPVNTVFIARDVLLSKKQEKLFRSVDSHMIPDYYYHHELLKAGEVMQ